MTAQMFRQHGDAVWRYVRRRVPESEVDDVVSEVFFVLARGKQVPAGERALPWLYAVAYRVVQKNWSHAGQAWRLTQRLSSMPPPLAAPDPADQVSTTAWLNDLLGRLKAEDAELLRLVVFEDLSVAAAAAVLGITVGSAHTRLHRTRRRLQPWLESHRRPSAGYEPAAFSGDHR